jgi:hypothetical protein
VVHRDNLVVVDSSAARNKPTPSQVS